MAGISIGSNDLTQLVLGVDRDSELLADVFDERDPAVLAYLAAADPAGARARPADLDLRPGALGAPGVRRAPRACGHRRRLGEHGRGRPHPAAARGGGAAAAARGRAAALTGQPAPPRGRESRAGGLRARRRSRPRTRGCGAPPRRPPRRARPRSGRPASPRRLCGPGRSRDPRRSEASCSAASPRSRCHAPGAEAER